MVFDPRENLNVQAIGESGCWIWLGAVNGHGYGSVRHKGRVWGAHRLSKCLEVGSIPEALAVCHRCDEQLCVNPDHLFIGTWGDNNRDRESKGRGRQPKGSRHGMAKLTEADAAAIFLSPLSGVDAATKYGTSKHTVRRIRKRSQWRSATDGLDAPAYAVASKHPHSRQ